MYSDKQSEGILKKIACGLLMMLHFKRFIKFSVYWVDQKGLHCNCEACITPTLSAYLNKKKGYF